MIWVNYDITQRKISYGCSALCFSKYNYVTIFHRTILVSLASGIIDTNSVNSYL